MGKGHRASTPSPSACLPKPPGVHQPRSSHPPLLLSSCSELISLGQALQPSPGTPSLLPCRDLGLLTATCLPSAGFSSAVPEKRPSTLKTLFLCHTHPLATGYTSFSTHREPSREKRAAGGFHIASKVFLLLVLLSLWSPHPPRWAACRGSGELHRRCPVHVPILLLIDPPAPCLGANPMRHTESKNYLLFICN